MARILVAGRLLEGKTEEEVVALLGPPDARAGENPAYLGWRLGRFESRASLMFPYEFHLDLTLEGGKVTAAQVINMD